MQKSFKFQKNKYYFLKTKDKHQKTMICHLGKTLLELNSNKQLTIDLLKPFKIIDMYRNSLTDVVSLRVCQGKVTGWFKTVETGDAINWNEYISNSKD